MLTVSRNYYFYVLVAMSKSNSSRSRGCF